MNLLEHGPSVGKATYLGYGALRLKGLAAAVSGGLNARDGLEIMGHAGSMFSSL
ncbi:hypothetical protein [Paraburkholderia tagetis]|uniref:Uncharacterized protein n=1 Tax=Paraburkholderia tagetis TaxID=2913261 RepID=A0A9X1UMW5_9BURK|nr:hypothetical protein [Paraburkholderia tagetis]MCG5078324.1 hypothetical protein [Paraburkholderia tagetis]